VVAFTGLRAGEIRTLAAMQKRQLLLNCSPRRKKRNKPNNVEKAAIRKKRNVKAYD
jgi:hypothetical protein